MNSTSPPQKTPDDEHPELSTLNAKSGLWLFALYFAAYAIFIELAVAWPDVLGLITPLGVNVAVTYGLGLIFGAVLLALVYMLLCKRNADRVARGGSP